MHPTQTPRRMSSAVAPPVSTSPLAVGGPLPAILSGENLSSEIKSIPGPSLNAPPSPSTSQAPPNALSLPSASTGGVSTAQPKSPLPSNRPRFSVGGTSAFENPRETASSEKVDEVGVALNINTTSFFKLRPIRQVIFVFGAFVTGLGVAAMHYCGVAAMKVPGVTMRHHSGVVLLAIAIGVTVAMAGLWILFFLRGFIPRLLSPFVIGIAVFSLHYVGMYGVTFELNSDLFSFDYDGFMQTNKFLVGGLRIEAVRAQVDFTLELVILAISFHTLQI